MGERKEKNIFLSADRTGGRAEKGGGEIKEEGKGKNVASLLRGRGEIV